MDMSKRDLKTSPYSMDINIATLPKRGLKTKPYSIDMEKKDLKKLTKGQLIKLLMKQSNSVKQMVNKHEDIIQPPAQFRDGYKPIPPPRTGK